MTTTSSGVTFNFSIKKRSERVITCGSVPRVPMNATGGSLLNELNILLILVLTYTSQTQKR